MTIIRQVRRYFADMKQNAGILVSLVVFISIAQLSCKKDVGTRFDMVYPEQIFTIPAGLDPFKIHYFVIRDIPLNRNFYYTQNNITDPDRLKIVPRRARFTSIFGNVDYEFIEEVAVQFSTPENPEQYFDMFFRMPVPLKNGPVLDLAPTLLEIQSLLKSDFMNLRVRLRLRGPSPEFVETQLTFSLIGEYQP